MVDVTQEPVAWMYERKDTGVYFAQGNRAHMDSRYWTEVPLFANPLRSDALPQDVVTLVIAAREAWDVNGASGDDLDQALEAFGERVPYDDEPAALKQGEPR